MSSCGFGSSILPFPSFGYMGDNGLSFFFFFFCNQRISHFVFFCFFSSFFLIIKKVLKNYIFFLKWSIFDYECVWYCGSFCGCGL
jgi:hypothetical protein